jgi:type II secretory pathway component GspD/PulD (secretin)
MKNSKLLVSVGIALLSMLTLLPFQSSAHAVPKRAQRAEARRAKEAKEAQQAKDAKPERLLQVYTLKNSSAPALTKTLMPLFPGSAETRMVIVCDQRTNSIIARGPQAELEILQSLLIRLDEPMEPEKPKE